MRSFGLHFNVAMLMFWIGIVVIDIRHGDPFFVHFLVCVLLVLNISIIVYIDMLRARMNRLRNEVRNPCIFKA